MRPYEQMNYKISITTKPYVVIHLLPAKIH